VKTVSAAPLPSAAIDRICVPPGPPWNRRRFPSGDQSGKELVPWEVKRVPFPVSTSNTQANHQPEQERIEYLQKKIQTKDEVLAELMAEHIALKKSLGEL
jgi:hypothetical protein